MGALVGTAIDIAGALAHGEAVPVGAAYGGVVAVAKVDPHTSLVRGHQSQRVHRNIRASGEDVIACRAVGPGKVVLLTQRRAPSSLCGGIGVESDLAHVDGQ